METGKPFTGALGLFNKEQVEADHQILVERLNVHVWTPEEWAALYMGYFYRPVKLITKEEAKERWPDAGEQKEKQNG